MNNKQDLKRSKVFIVSHKTKRQHKKTFQLQEQKPKTQQKQDPKTELENMFWTNITPQNTRIEGKTTFDYKQKPKQ